MSKRIVVKMASTGAILLAFDALSDSPLARTEERGGFTLSQATLGLIPEVQPAVVLAVAARFGEPSRPLVKKEFPVGANAVDGRSLYERHCLRCHGGSGDGAGPESKALDPRPRDFRLGKFKWKSTERGIKPTRHDLRETIRLGIPQTAMPAFAKLTEDDASAVVEYIRWLGMAGEFEVRIGDELAAEGLSNFEVARRLAGGEKRRAILDDAARFVREDLPGAIEEIAKSVAGNWEESELESNVIRPKTKPIEYSAASVARGSALFRLKRTECHQCHGDEGKGDGAFTRSFWSIPNSQPERKYAKPGLHDEWGHPQKPWDLHAGTFRGGDAPDDLYRRIVEGIPGTMMAGYKNVLKDDEVWDVVNFLQSLRPDKLRGKEAAPRRPTPAGIKN